MGIFYKTYILPIILIILLVACSNFLSKNRIQPEEALRNRVEAYWDARLQGSYEKAYELLEPKAKEVISLASYGNRTGKSDILAYEIMELDLDLKKQRCDGPG